jgi:hypothetical protein
MSEPGPESIPTSADPRSKRPTKKRALTPVSKHVEHVEALFAHPDKQVQIPLTANEVALRRLMPPPPEIVQNVQGSSAGAGSGEFHVYKASRRRENERIRLMDEEVEKEQRDREWEEKRLELKKKDEEKRNKNKAKRDKAKARKDKAKGGGTAEDGKMDMEKKITAKAGPKLPRPMSINAEGAHGGEVKAVEEVGILIHDDDD